MDAFNYLSVLLSLILGLAITQILMGFRGLMQSRSRLVTYWPTVLWSILVLVIAVQSWWAMFGLRHTTDWTFLVFAVVLLQTIVVYLLAALVLPDFFGEAPVDLRVYFYAQRTWFFVLLTLLVAVSLCKQLVLEGRVPASSNLAFHLIFATLAITGALTDRARVHEFLAVFTTGALGAYIGLLFKHLR